MRAWAKSGNTDTKSANAKLDVATVVGSWKHAAGLAAIYASEDEVTSGQRWEVHEPSDYNFSPKSFWFGAARYEDDRFSGMDEPLNRARPILAGAPSPSAIRCR